MALSEPNMLPWAVGAILGGVFLAGMAASFMTIDHPGWPVLGAVVVVVLFTVAATLFLYHVAWVDYERDLVDRWGQLVECVMRAPEGRGEACIP